MGIKGTPAGDHDPYRGGKKGLKKNLYLPPKMVLLLLQAK